MQTSINNPLWERHNHKGGYKTLKEALIDYGVWHEYDDNQKKLIQSADNKTYY